MTDQSNSEITKINPKEITTIEMDLSAAHTVLRTIVYFKEESIFEYSDKIGVYSREQIMSAVQIVGEDLTLRHKAKEIPPTFYAPSYHEIEKKGPKGTRMKLSIRHIRNSKQSENITLSLKSKDKSILWDQFPFLAWDDVSMNPTSGFIDHRTEKYVMANDLYNKGIKDYRFMLRGLRWLSANLLTWDRKGIIMPEQLDSPTVLSDPPSKSLEK